MPEETIKDDIPITPEMIEAGLNILWDSCAIEHPLDADRLVVEQIYYAMRLAQASHQQGLK